MKIAICTVACYPKPLEPHNDFVTVTNELKKRYCERHGIRFVYSTDNPLAPATSHWAKFPILEHALKDDGADWAVWMDADAAPVNMDADLEAFLSKCDQTKMVMAKDVLGWNSGVFAVPNTGRALEWLRKMYSHEIVEHYGSHHDLYPFFDQNAIVDSISGEYADFVHEPDKAFGWNQYDKIYAFYSDGMPNEFRETEKHWCLHIPGFANAHRKQRFLYFLLRDGKIPCPVCGMHGDEYISGRPSGGQAWIYCKCPHCGMVYLANEHAIDDHEAAGLDESEQATNVRVNRLASVLTLNMPRLLEIGYGEYTFTKWCREHGLQTDFMEPWNSGRTDRIGQVSQYTMAVAFHALEREREVGDAFATAAHWLLRGSLLVIENPLIDKDEHYTLTTTAKWIPDGCGVKRLYTTKALELLAYKHGFVLLPDKGNGSMQVLAKM